jgi:hypothetical protein
VDDVSSFEQWTASIKAALVNEQTAVPGPAGETPLGDLILQIRAVDPASAEMEAVQRALEKVVVDSSKSDAEWWMNLANLLTLSGIPTRGLGLTLDRLLSSGDPPDPKARARVFVAASNLGRRFTLRRLEADADIREHFPLQWTDVAVVGGELPAATACISNAVRRGAISASDLILRLPAWFQCLGDRFVPFVTDWYDALSAADQNSIGDWLRRRRIQFNPRADVAASGLTILYTDYKRHARSSDRSLLELNTRLAQATISDQPPTPKYMARNSLLLMRLVLR